MSKAKAMPLNQLFNNPVYYYFIIFITLTILFHLIWGTVWFFDYIIEPVNTLYAGLASTLLSWMGWQTTAEGTSVVSPFFHMNIAIGCDGIQATAMFIIAMLPLSTDWKHKGKGIIIGIFCLCLLNLIRIISLYFTGVYFPSIFEFMHIQFWQVTFIIAAGLLWMYWFGSKK